MGGENEFVKNEFYLLIIFKSVYIRNPRLNIDRTFCRGEHKIPFVSEEVRRDLHGAVLRLKHPHEHHGSAGEPCLPSVQSATAR